MQNLIQAYHIIVGFFVYEGLRQLYYTAVIAHREKLQGVASIIQYAISEATLRFKEVKCSFVLDKKNCKRKLTMRSGSTA